MGLKSPRICTVCGRPGLYILQRMFSPIWRSIPCRFCGAVFEHSWGWNLLWNAIATIIGAPAMFAAFWAPDPWYRIPALILVVLIFAVGAWLPLVQKNPPLGRLVR